MSRLSPVLPRCRTVRGRVSTSSVLDLVLPLRGPVRWGNGWEEHPGPVLPRSTCPVLLIHFQGSC
jgi:hypothetical protein